MRKLSLLFLFIFQISSILGQVHCGDIAIPKDWNFDEPDTPYDYFLKIDTDTYPNNIWQIGYSRKTIINNSYSSPNIIITDTLNPYPPNDTSVFIFKHVDQGGYSDVHSAEIAGYYNVNSDSLNDYGTIEISLNQGETWINLITDTEYSGYYEWRTPKPILTGNSNGWQNFWVSVSQLGQVFNVEFNDTVLIKFTFISDANSESLDGLAFDNFQFCDGTEGINEVLNNNLIEIYPNPVNDILYIDRKTEASQEILQLINCSGLTVYTKRNFKSDYINLKEIGLGNGIYFLKYSDSKSYSIRKIIVQH